MAVSGDRYEGGGDVLHLTGMQLWRWRREIWFLWLVGWLVGWLAGWFVGWLAWNEACNFLSYLRKHEKLPTSRVIKKLAQL